MMTSELIVSSRDIKSMLEHARHVHPDECCGLLVGMRRPPVLEAFKVIPCRNVATDAQTSFEVAPSDLFQAHHSCRASKTQILGWYHSHPCGDPIPSATDAARSNELGKIWLVISGDQICAYEAVELGSIHGRFEACRLTIEKSGRGIDGNRRSKVV